MLEVEHAGIAVHLKDVHQLKFADRGYVYKYVLVIEVKHEGFLQ